MESVVVVEVGPLAVVEVLVLCFPVVRCVIWGVQQHGVQKQTQRKCFVEQQGMRQLQMSHFVALENP